MDASEDEYDPDLEGVLYQEYWTDLKEFKPKKKKAKSRENSKVVKIKRNVGR